MEERARKIGEWLLSGDTGISSEAIASVMLGVLPEDVVALSKWGETHPRDPSDFGRCLRLVRMLDCRTDLELMRRVSKPWEAVVTHWDRWAWLYDTESKRSDGKAPKLYDEMSKNL